MPLTSEEFTEYVGDVVNEANFEAFHRDRWERALDQAWFLWRGKRYDMEKNRKRWKYSQYVDFAAWRTLLRWMQEDR